MKNIVKINSILGWTLIIGIIVSQLIITIVTFNIGRMAPFYAFLTAIIFLSYIPTAIAGVLSRELNPNKIKTGIIIGLIFQLGLPIVLPLFFDKELIYLSLVGFFLGLIMLYFRKNDEIQLLILNGIGAIIWVLISLTGLLSF